MQIRLKRLSIENFKGVRKKEIEFSSTTDIYGANATGKTTIFDAFNWLLFNKDSNGAERFDIRPLDVNGNRIDNVEIHVMALIEVDGKEVALDKVQKQNWVTKRGTKVAELQGNPNTYEIDGIPKGEADYKEYIANVINEDLFKLITNPSAFPSIPWRKQREKLMSMISVASDVDIAKTDKKFESLIKKFESFSVDDLTAKAQKALKELKKQQVELPSRIDEVSKSIVEVDLAEQELNKIALQEQLSDIDNREEAAALSFDEVNRISDDILKLKIERSRIEREVSSEAEAKKEALLAEKEKAERDFQTAFSKHSQFEAAIKNNQQYIEADKVDVQELRTAYRVLQSKELDINSTKCAVCGQELPLDQIEKIHNEFNSKKQSELSNIQKKGKAINEDMERLTAEILKYEAEIETLKQAKIEANKSNAEVEEKLLLITEPVLSANHEHVIVLDKIKELEKQLSEMETGADYRKQLKQQKTELQADLYAVEKVLASTESNERAEKRIVELEEEQKEVGQEVADQECELFLLEEFTRAKMSLLSSNVNNHFRIVNWKMFDIQLNGGLKETCECMVNGVPFASVNTAGKIQAGIDIINTLSQLYEVSAPIWIDNRESCTDIPSVDAQIINLYVSENEKTLKVEV